jgi:uncharacterized membrane protein YeaQ/YmgE (transglycosylase-associated protein family)
MSIVWMILIEFVVGLLAKLLTPGRDPSGFFNTAAIGIAERWWRRLLDKRWAFIRQANPQDSSARWLAQLSFSRSITLSGANRRSRRFASEFELFRVSEHVTTSTRRHSLTSA